MRQRWHRALAFFLVCLQGHESVAFASGASTPTVVDCSRVTLGVHTVRQGDTLSRLLASRGLRPLWGSGGSVLKWGAALGLRDANRIHIGQKLDFAAVCQEQGKGSVVQAAQRNPAETGSGPDADPAPTPTSLKTVAMETPAIGAAESASAAGQLTRNASRQPTGLRFGVSQVFARIDSVEDADQSRAVLLSESGWGFSLGLSLPLTDHWSLGGEMRWADLQWARPSRGSLLTQRTAFGGSSLGGVLLSGRHQMRFALSVEQRPLVYSSQPSVADLDSVWGLGPEFQLVSDWLTFSQGTTFLSRFAFRALWPAAGGALEVQSAWAGAIGMIARRPWIERQVEIGLHYERSRDNAKLVAQDRQDLKLMLGLNLELAP